MNRLHFLLIMVALGVLGLLCGCQTIDYKNDYTLDYVPVDDIGDVDAPVAYYAAPQEQPVKRFQLREKKPAPQPEKTIAAADPVEEPKEKQKQKSQDGRVMQVASVQSLDFSSPVPEFGMAERRFVKQPEESAAQVKMEPKIVPAARITHVNLGDKYVILKCEKLPKPGEDAQIFRGDQLVGVVRFVSSRKGQYIVADIIEGEPQRGDLAKFKCLFPRKVKKATKSEKPKIPPKDDPKKRARGLPLFF